MMSESGNLWTLSPDSLKTITADYIRNNLVEQFLKEDKARSANRKDTGSQVYKLREGVQLPHIVWDLLLQGRHKRVNRAQLSLLNALADAPLSYPIQKLCLRNAVELTDELLEKLIVNCPKELDIHNCPALTQKTFYSINKFGKNLETLVIGSTVQILPTEIIRIDSDSSAQGGTELPDSAWRTLFGKISNFSSSTSESKLLATEKSGQDSYEYLETPNLVKLVIWGLHVKQKQPGLLACDVDYWGTLTEKFIRNIIFLDLSYCQEFKDFNFIVPARNSLEQLILHDVLIPDDPFGWDVLMQMSNVRSLDVSQSMELAAVFNHPDALLGRIVGSLKKLAALDISGTNLAGHAAEEIVGLASHAETPLDFLGLLGTHYNASKRLNIPAKQITGSNSEVQLLNSLNRYIERPGMLKKALRMFYGKLVKDNEYGFSKSCFNLTLDALEIHVEDKHVMLVGLCVLFNMMKKLMTEPEPDLAFKLKLYFTSKLRKRIVTAVMQAITAHSYDLTLLRNSFILLCLLDVSDDLAPFLHQMVDMLLLSIELALANSDFFLLRTSYFLMKLLICLANLEDKKQLGAAGAIKRLCSIVETCTTKNILDYMPTSWIVLEYLTDGIEENCAAFIKSGGLDLVMKLKLQMPINLALPAAMGVLTNVASVPVNRQYFMKKEYISAIFQMMNQSGNGESFEGIENYRRLSYAASGCMIWLVGDSSWSCNNPNKLEILQKLKELVKSWDYRLSMGIEHTTLEPMLLNLNAADLECRSFVVWTLANLTFLRPKKYIPMLGDPSSFLSSCKKAICTEDDPLEWHTNMLANFLFENVKNFSLE